MSLIIWWCVHINPGRIVSVFSPNCTESFRKLTQVALQKSHAKMGCGHCKHMNHEIVKVNGPDPRMLTGLMRKNLGTRLTEHCVWNWKLFASSHLTYSHLTYSHFTYFRPKSDVLPTLKKDMKGSEPEWSNQKQVASQVISYVQMLEYPVAGVTIYTIKNFGYCNHIWSSQLHACCVRDMLQTSWDASYFNHSLSVVKKLLHFGNWIRIFFLERCGVSLILHICPSRSSLVIWLCGKCQKWSHIARISCKKIKREKLNHFVSNYKHLLKFVTCHMHNRHATEMTKTV